MNTSEIAYDWAETHQAQLDYVVWSALRLVDQPLKSQLAAELESECMYRLPRIVGNYDGRKSALTTHVVSCLKWHCWTYLEKFFRKSREIPESCADTPLHSVEYSVGEPTISESLDELPFTLSESEGQALKLRLMGYTYEEIGEQMGESKTAIRIKFNSLKDKYLQHV